MKNKHNKKMLAVLLGIALAHTSSASDQTAASGLLPWGAEKEGNAAGTIPAYTGVVPVPESYEAAMRSQRPSPFADEAPLYIITRENLDTYKDLLSEGLMAMLKKHETFKVVVYPSHRTMRYPKHIIENSRLNQASCKTLNDGLSISECYGGMLFPVPKTGNEVMWNHVAKYSSSVFEGEHFNIFVDREGRALVQAKNYGWQEYPTHHEDKAGVMLKGGDPYWIFRADSREPARKSGEKLLFIDHIDPVAHSRKVWQYIPGQRRVKLAPDMAYDTPNPQAGGASVMDEANLFMGAQDRYDFKLLGKREMLIPYNNYSTYECEQTKLISKGHLNPDCVRFELHRVWEVEANLKPGKRHVYPRRKFYFDEDMPGTGLADAYDASGEIYRVSLSYFIPWYETEDQSNSDMVTTYDLGSGSYYVGAYSPGKNGPAPGKRKDSRFFTGDALTGAGVR